MNIKQILGLIVIVAGIALIANAKFAMDRTGETIRKKLTGKYASGTRRQLYSGVGLAILGAAVLVYFKERK